MEELKRILSELLKPLITEAVKEAFADVKVNPPKRYYTVEEAMEYIHVSRATFYRMVGRGEIELLKIGSKSLVDAEKLDGQIERREIYRYKHRL